MADGRVGHAGGRGDKGVAPSPRPRHDRPVRRAFLTLLLASLPAVAAARDGEMVRVSGPAAPSAIVVDGVKVGAELVTLPKQAPQRTRCTSSGCTIVVTY